MEVRWVCVWGPRGCGQRVGTRAPHATASAASQLVSEGYAPAPPILAVVGGGHRLATSGEVGEDQTPDKGGEGGCLAPPPLPAGDPQPSLGGKRSNSSHLAPGSWGRGAVPQAGTGSILDSGPWDWGCRLGVSAALRGLFVELGWGSGEEQRHIVNRDLRPLGGLAAPAGEP